MSAYAWPLVALLLGLAGLLALSAGWAAWLRQRADGFMDDDERDELQEAAEKLQAQLAQAHGELTDRLVRMENKLGFTR